MPSFAVPLLNRCCFCFCCCCCFCCAAGSPRALLPRLSCSRTSSASSRLAGTTSSSGSSSSSRMASRAACSATCWMRGARHRTRWVAYFTTSFSCTAMMDVGAAYFMQVHFTLSTYWGGRHQGATAAAVRQFDSTRGHCTAAPATSCIQTSALCF
jgi:hypothetical protein